MTPRTAKRPRPSYADSASESDASPGSASDDYKQPKRKSIPPKTRRRPSNGSTRSAPSRISKRGAKKDETSSDEEHEEESEEESEQQDDDYESDESQDEVQVKRAKGTKGSSKAVKPSPSKSKSSSSGAAVTSITKLVSAPKTGHVPEGQISPNLIDFLSDLKDPEKNDREWFAVNQKRYEYSLNNFKVFGEKLLDDFIEQVDETLPWVPSKDWIYRIYRDIRFSNDKTPYKTSFSATFCRGGRKGPYAGYHLVVSPGRTSLHAGTWCPEKLHLQRIRSHILSNSAEALELKRLIASKPYVNRFGPAEPLSATKRTTTTTERQTRQSFWGLDDELKIAPKMEGVDKDHKDIALLKLKSFVLTGYFDDDEVLSPDFRDKLIQTGKLQQKVVELLNRMMFPEDE